VQAAVSLSKLEWKEATDIVKTYIKDVLQAFITLMSQVDCEQLAEALAVLIERPLGTSQYRVCLSIIANYKPLDKSHLLLTILSASTFLSLGMSS
jgi:hypothetical protein